MSIFEDTYNISCPRWGRSLTGRVHFCSLYSWALKNMLMYYIKKYTAKYWGIFWEKRMTKMFKPILIESSNLRIFNFDMSTTHPYETLLVRRQWWLIEFVLANRSEGFSNKIRSQFDVNFLKHCPLFHEISCLGTDQWILLCIISNMKRMRIFNFNF